MHFAEQRCLTFLFSLSENYEIIDLRSTHTKNSAQVRELRVYNRVRDFLQGYGKTVGMGLKEICDV